MLAQITRFIHYEVQEMYHWLLWRSATQALGHMHGCSRHPVRLQAFFDVKFCRQ